MTPDKLEASIGREADPNKLRQWAKNLDARGNTAAANLARRRLYHVLTSAEEGSLAFDVWRSIHSLEDMLTTERQRTTRLSRTRQKIARIGEQATVADLVNSAKPSEGFRLLVERGFNDLLFESLVLQHPDKFDEATQAAAKRRLDSLASS